MLIVHLTEEQMLAIRPGFDRIAQMSKEGKPGMLLAQVYGDHMRVGVMSHEDALKIQQTIGRSVGQTHRTAYELSERRAESAGSVPQGEVTG